jgi:salicylate hydroxylase
MPVLIVGGGIGGLGTALALSRKGIPSHVIEQADEFKEIGAGIQLGPNVFRMFEFLGLTGEMNKLAVFPQGLEMRDSITGKTFVELPVDHRFFDKYHAPYAVIHRADMLDVIHQACKKSNLITLTTSQKVIGFDETTNGVSARTESGQTFTGAALVGCDGLWSTIRQILVGDGKPVVSGHIAYRAVVPTEEWPKEYRINKMILWGGEKTHLVHYPLRRGELFNLVAVFHSDRYVEGWNAEGATHELRAHFESQRPEVRRLLDRIETWRMWVLCDREPVRMWSRGRVALIGDAAHPMLQYLAQGACMAIEDAAKLGEEVARRPDDLPAAFDAYVKARYLRTARVQLMARVYGEFYHARGPTAELRDMMLGGRTVEEAYDGVAWLYAEAA